MGVFNLFFGIEGRINRATWWMCGLVFMVVNMILSAIIRGLLASMDQLGHAGPLAQNDAGIGGLASLILMYPMIAVGVKRMHDRDKSGWWIAAFIAPGLLLGLLLPVAAAAGTSLHSGLAWLVMVLTGLTILSIIWNVIECGFLGGTAGENEFGQPRSLGDVFAGGTEPSNSWANAVEFSAAATAAALPSHQQLAAPTGTPRKVLKPTHAKPSGFGRRPSVRA
jgi:uncharacterized membrane protein YhaH (DUF805 family)